MQRPTPRKITKVCPRSLVDNKKQAGVALMCESGPMAELVSRQQVALTA